MAQAEPKKRTGAVKKEKPEKKDDKQENGLIRYLRETRGEMRKVTWPTRDEAIRLTGIVLAVTAAFAVFLGLVDLVWSSILQEIIRFIVGA